MARAAKKKSGAKKPARRRRASAKRAANARFRPLRWLLRWGLRGTVSAVGVLFLAVVFYAVFDPPTTPYMLAEGRRLGGVDQRWVDLEAISPVMARSVVAAEDANFCLHWGFDMAAIREALEDGGNRGASTLSQQVVKNAYLWQGRSWARKALEAVMTPMVEAVWTKRRIIEVYLNLAEFGEGVFGVEAAARKNFRVGADELQPWQAARLAAVLPNPKGRSAGNASDFVKRRGRAIADGAATILSDGRADCLGG